MANPLPKYPEQDPTHDLGLEGQRLEAAVAVDRNILALAGPGSGKTHLLVAHAVYLARTQAGNVVVLTFSRNAAQELQERIASKLSSHENRQIAVGTIHSYAMRLLDAYGYRLGLGKPLEVLEESDIDALAREVAAKNGQPLVYGFAKRLSRLLRRRLLSESDQAGRTLEGMALLEMRRSGRLSWELCVDLAEELLRDPAVRSSLHHHDRFVLLDEAQDCDLAQLSFLRHLVGNNHVFVAMDPDQSLYAFRDADPTQALRWARKFEPQEFQLTESYRCPPRVIALANEILSKPMKHVGAGDRGATHFFFGSNRNKEAVFVADQVEARLQDGVPEGRIAVLCRENKPLNRVAEELASRDIDVRRKIQPEFSLVEQRLIGMLQLLHELEEGSALSPLALRSLARELASSEEVVQSVEAQAIRGEIMDLAVIIDNDQWLEVLQAREQAMHLSRFVRAVARVLDVEIPEEGPLVRIAHESRSLSLLLRRCRQGSLSATDLSGQVLVTTFHGSKGLEFETVFIMACEEGVIPRFRTPEDELVQERRALYVAITRASNEVVITAVRQDQSRNREPCRFLPLARRDLWTTVQGLPARVMS